MHHEGSFTMYGVECGTISDAKIVCEAKRGNMTYYFKQEYIPVGCVPSAAVAVPGGMSGQGVSAQGGVS